MMDNEIRLVSDRHGLAVLGRDSAAIERFLRSAGLWASSKELDLRRLRSTSDVAARVATEVSELTTHYGRWVKLTEESARLVHEHGLMESKTPGVSHLMVGTPGNVQNWLQTEHGLSALLTNPQVLSGLSGIMAQVSAQQNMAEITEYLARIDEKVDDVLRKVDDTVLKDMQGARFQIGRASTMRDQEGRVTDDSWSELQNVSGKIGDVQGYALGQLKAIAEKLEVKARISGLARVAEQAEPEVRKWLAVLAECFQLQEAFDVLALDRYLEMPAEVLDRRRRGLEADRQDRLNLIAGHTGELLTRMDAAVGQANAGLFWNRTKAPVVVESGNHVATGVHDFQSLLGIQADQRSWERRQLGRVAEIGAQAIQKTKDATPLVASAGALVVAGALIMSKVQTETETDSESES